jgi:hypothetical protein
VSLACCKTTELGYPHELWATRLMARHAREHGSEAGHNCLANLVQGAVCKILARHELKPHKVRSYLECRDAEFEEKMAQVLGGYREVQVLKKAAGGKKEAGEAVPIVSYDEKPCRCYRPRCRRGRSRRRGCRGSSGEAEASPTGLQRAGSRFMTSNLRHLGDARIIMLAARWTGRR